MSTTPTVLLLGATGRTGRRVLEQLLARGVGVRAIVRSAARLAPGIGADPRLTVVEADPLALDDAALVEQVRDCGTAISCLGHTISLAGVFGPPRDLVARATRRLCGAIRASRPAAPVKLVVMTSVSVNQPNTREPRRGAFERALLALLRALVPPSRDHQRAADFLAREVGTADPLVRWVVVRPDSLLEGEVSRYVAHDHLVDSLARPGKTRMANVAHFMCELATDARTWERWEGRLPVVVDVAGAGAAQGSRSVT